MLYSSPQNQLTLFIPIFFRFVDVRERKGKGETEREREKHRFVVPLDDAFIG